MPQASPFKKTNQKKPNRDMRIHMIKLVACCFYGVKKKHPKSILFGSWGAVHNDMLFIIMMLYAPF